MCGLLWKITLLDLQSFKVYKFIITFSLFWPIPEQARSHTSGPLLWWEQEHTSPEKYTINIKKFTFIFIFDYKRFFIIWLQLLKFRKTSTCPAVNEVY